MNREELIQRVYFEEIWDVIIIGGGATGLGAAVDAASRGFKTLLLEQKDFAQGTSSKSTKLIHGGLRYLQNGDISLVTEALHERGRLCQNAPHLIHHLPFLVPIYKWWEGPFYGIGLKVYDLLSGKLGIEPSQKLSKQETIKAIPTIEKKDLRGGVMYYDGQFDDARLATTLALTALDHGACVLNYFKVTSFSKKKGVLTGVRAIDTLTKKRFHIHGKVIINATGAFADALRHKDRPKTKNIISPSQGVHLVLPKEFLPKKTSLLIPKTEDKRVLFMVPWHDKVLVGTTDTPLKSVVEEPKPLKKEIEFILKNIKSYLTREAQIEDILSVFVGIRPLVKNTGEANTAALSRDHTIEISPSGLITIVGGKWTTYRKMAEDVIDKAIELAHLEERTCITKNLKLHGHKEGLDPTKIPSQYGSDNRIIKELIQESPSLKYTIHPNLPYTWAQVLFSLRFEHAHTVEDVLCRRTRSILLDARATREIAPLVAQFIAKEKGFSESWIKGQIREFMKFSRSYLPF